MKEEIVIIDYDCVLNKSTWVIVVTIMLWFTLGLIVGNKFIKKG